MQLVKMELDSGISLPSPTVLHILYLKLISLKESIKNIIKKHRKSGWKTNTYNK